MAVRLSELLDHGPFGLRLVTSSVTTNRIVRGVTPIEWPEPGRWLAPGYLVMTNGMALRGHPDKQQRFVEDVHRAGAPAVGLWLDATFKAPPPAMVNRAEELGLPMFTAPYELPSREIISFVISSVLTVEDRSLSRTVTAQDYLLDALGKNNPIAALVARLQTVLRAAVAVFSPVGEVLAAAGSPPLDRMWSAIRADQDVVALGRYWLFTALALVGEVPFAHLAVRLHDKPRPSTYDDSVVRFAVRVLQMIGLAGHARAELEGASRIAVLRDLLDVATPDRALVQRLSVLGFSADAQARIVVADVVADASLDETRRRFNAAFAHRHLVSICDISPQGVVALVERDQRDQSERSALADICPDATGGLLRVGVGLAVRLTEGVQQSHREAKLALLRARRESCPSVWFDDIGFADKLLSYLPADRLASAAELLAPLRDERPNLLQTLNAYLERDCSVLATADALHLHPNSLRYRLSVIERVLGRSLSSLDTLLELTLALRIDAIADDGARDSHRETVARAGS